MDQLPRLVRPPQTSYAAQMRRRHSDPQPPVLQPVDLDIVESAIIPVAWSHLQQDRKIQPSGDEVER